MDYSSIWSVDKIDADLLLSFDQLAEDRHLRGGNVFRYRAFGEATVKGDQLDWTDAASFFQPEGINSYMGGVTRSFAPLGQAARRFAEALAHDPELRACLDIEDFTLGCHQIRTVASDDFNGTPTPEGFHRDGFTYVAITCIATNNVNGAASIIRTADKNEMVVLDRWLAVGETLILDDRRFQHYVTPFTPKLPGRPTYRDIVVLTFDGQ